ncbi:hypothetical protein SAMN05421774_101461 [Gemmobacter megaterium]|uniref:Secreted protein n=1 Tax=Gemmobacter megaterium TaxID=1086013 RepID=A0A1N7KIA9_9RHOB|nr:hypothetical protein [Gemmobacter megaterium]GGE02326.1 hypothetical protein GCM10011345_04510 [Gemmobacter megaterium]SIS61352.1 hypothetical protein SAMN05421774_101461 [Gemmobacter megaterium]
MYRHLSLVAAGLLAATPAMAQQFTTAAEIRPILEATRASWLALRPWDGKELLYFTHLESWRCGMAEVRFSVNSSAATRVWDMPPCQTGTAQPNAIPADRLPFAELPPEALQTVTVVVVLADGTELRQDYTRANILMP